MPRPDSGRPAKAHPPDALGSAGSSAPAGARTAVSQLESRYGRRLAELSAGFLSLETSEIDAGIAAGVAAVAELAEVDRAFLYDLSGSVPGQVEQTYAWQREGLDPRAAPALDAEGGRQFGWALSQLLEGRAVHIPRVADLPSEAAVEKQDLERRGVRAALGLPILRDQQFVGYLSVECLNTEREFSAAEIELLRLAGGLLAGVIKRRQAEETIARQLAFESRAAEVSRHLMTLDGARTQSSLRSALAKAAELAGAERSYLLAYPVGRGERFTSVQWCAEGVAATEPKPIPWATDSVLRGEILHIPSVGGLAPELRADSRDLLARGVRSLLGFPIASGEGPVGFVGFETFQAERHWSPHEISLLGLVGEFFANALRRKGIEDALRASQTQLQQAQKMEAVGRLAGGIAHDFNNLLTVILGNSEALIDRFGPADAARVDADEIHRAALRAASLTRQLLAFSSRPVEEPDRVDLGPVVLRLEGMLGRLVATGVELSVHVQDGESWVNGSASQFEQVLVNLVVNASNAMPEGGCIAVDLFRQTLTASDASRLRLHEAKEVVVLRVSDPGVGMDDDTCGRIFEPFFTTRELGEGTGLGLSIVYSIVHQSKGAIEVRSAPGEGSVFELYLPNVAPRVELESAPQVPAEGRRCSGTVLFVEDENAVRRLGRRVLERGGFDVLEASDGVEALELVASYTGSIDLLVTDVVMPRMGGAELAARSIAELPSLQVLYISGYPHGRDDSGGTKLSRGEMLPKPFTGDQLLDKVVGLLADRDAGLGPNAGTR